MMPLAMLPAIPMASTRWRGGSLSAAPTPAAAPIAPNSQVGWKPALWTMRGATVLSRQVTSAPTASPSSAAAPSSVKRSAAEKIAGAITTPAWTGPPSNVSSKSSPCAAVPLISAAPALSQVRLWPITVQPPSPSTPSIAAWI